MRHVFRFPDLRNVTCCELFIWAVCHQHLSVLCSGLWIKWTYNGKGMPHRPHV